MQEITDLQELESQNRQQYSRHEPHIQHTIHGKQQMKNEILVFADEKGNLSTIVKTEGVELLTPFNDVLSELGFRYGVRLVPEDDILTIDGDVIPNLDETSTVLNGDDPNSWFST